ncbi:hypothetical protein [Phenylobacterium sp.]|uniref:spike base protein, RCAP_Rcc01079 family n=1 Tax=Phenylobacterium sp. TaxID=1871053 RepID=UPI0025E6052E|nr:hypothetical protein [Phenylobacterium sp.]
MGGKSSAIWSASKIVAVTKASTPLPGGTCRGLLVGTAGTANVTDADGNASDSVPLQAGYNPLQLTHVRTGGTATDIWALY